MFVTNWISTTKIQKISEITNFFRHYFLSRTEVITTSTFMIDAAKIHSFLFHSYAICDNCVDSGNKVGENYIFMPYLEIRRNISEE